MIDRHCFIRWRPVEADTPLRKGHWFWSPNAEDTLKSVAELLATYDETVGRGGQLVLGVAPDTRGLLPEVDAKRLKELGAALRERYGRNLVRREHGAAPLLRQRPSTMIRIHSGPRRRALTTDRSR